MGKPRRFTEQHDGFRMCGYRGRQGNVEDFYFAEAFYDGDGPTKAHWAYLLKGWKRGPTPEPVGGEA